MKKTAMLIAGLMLIALTLTSCGTLTLPITATGNPLGTKVGEASGITYLFIFGDASNANIVQAAKNGRITKISTVDYKANNLLNLIQTYTCVVTGE